MIYLAVSSPVMILGKGTTCSRIAGGFWGHHRYCSELDRRKVEAYDGAVYIVHP
jgi:hypothetical protein